MPRLETQAPITTRGKFRWFYGRAAEDMVLRKTQELLARFPPIYRKIERRRQLVVSTDLPAGM